MPLPEHPRPDWERPQWRNLNGEWAFQFDSLDRGIGQEWFIHSDFEGSIQVPFSWGAPLSGVPDEADMGWYAHDIETPADWSGRRVYLVIGAADWHTTAWLDGRKLGEHRGGYTPFEFELTDYLKAGEKQRLVLRIDDTPHPFKLEGKQGYGPARGVWQTPYLEVRGDDYLDHLLFFPDIENEQVGVEVHLPAPAAVDLPLTLIIRGNGAALEVTETIPAGLTEHRFLIDLPGARLWTLEDPHLYEVEASLGGGATGDIISTYFGMRDISVVDLPGTDYRYVALNGEPIYLQLALDQAYHPEGYYTFPSDAFMRDEILRSRRIGLNGMRIHVKVGIPRKLYWADRLGMLIMADVPNSWGEPTADMRREIDYAMRRMIHRDFNHPSIFSWVIFNETWGLYTSTDEGTDQRTYLPETQQWVVSMYEAAKALDPTRLVEDNSVCCGIGHTATDLNTWHSYLPGWAWREALARMDTATYEGGAWNFEQGYRQGRQPNINSEFGNVWGYEGSTGDVDWTWDYHRALNEFRRFPRIAGWLYTEHHDVVNEWNGYWRYDRSEKITGLDELVPGMSLKDLHAPFYVSTGQDISAAVRPNTEVSLPIYLSFLTGRRDVGDTLTLRFELYGWDGLGRRKTYESSAWGIPYEPWKTGRWRTMNFRMPGERAVLVLAMTLEDMAGNALHRNFTTFIVEGDIPAEATLDFGRRTRLLEVEPAAFAAAEWSLKQWDVLDGKKVNGAGAGYFEYRIPWPSDLGAADLSAAAFVFEASAKQLFGKDRDDATAMGGDYMRGGGTFDPSRNPNAYPMTDEDKRPSAVSVIANGVHAGRYELPDDPADHRGILSWHYQLKDRKLREAGSYGYRISATLPPQALEAAAAAGELVLRLQVDEALPGGLAIYGDRFGRYPLNPTVVLVRK